MPARQLTEEQQCQWAIDGYLVLPGVLSQTEVKRLIREVDRLYRKYVTQSPNGDPKKGLDHRNAIEDSDVLLELIDRPAMFDLVLDLLGPYIQLSMAEVLVRPPNPDYKGFIQRTGHIRPLDRAVLRAVFF